MNTRDDWERWLHLGGVSDDTDDTGDAGDVADARADDGVDEGVAGGADQGAAARSTRPAALEIDDPWGTLDVEITPLTEAQREYLRLAAPTVLDELGAGVEPDDEFAVDVAVSDELSSAFGAIDEIEETDDADDADDADEAGEAGARDER